MGRGSMGSCEEGKAVEGTEDLTMIVRSVVSEVELMK